MGKKRSQSNMGTNSRGKRAMAAEPGGTANKDSTTCYLGVRRRPWGRYEAQIKNHCATLYLGTFDTPKEAAHAYDTAARALRGHEARTNFPFPSAMHIGHVAAGDIPAGGTLECASASCTPTEPSLLFPRTQPQQEQQQQLQLAVTAQRTNFPFPSAMPSDK